MRSNLFKKLVTVAGIVAAFVLQGCVTLHSPRKAYRQLEKNRQQFDAIIVPGIPFDGANWNETMKWRVLWSWILYKNGIAKNVIYSGSAVYTPYCEAEIMGLYARQLGIPAEHIFYETRAEHSTENVFFSYEVARKQGFKTLAVATEYNQAILLKGFARRRFATRIAVLPIYEDMVEPYLRLPDPVIDPAPARRDNFKALPDAVSTWERMKGTIGKNIPWETGTGRKAAPL